MEDLKVELRKVRQILWIVAGLLAVFLVRPYLPTLTVSPAKAESAPDVVRIDVVKVGGHNVVGRALPVEIRE